MRYAEVILNLETSKDYFKYFESRVINLLSTNLSWADFETQFDHISWNYGVDLIARV